MIKERKGKFNDEVITRGIGIGIFNDNVVNNYTILGCEEK
jgi:hypothetical protein